MTNTVNRPKVSRFIAGTYIVFAVFIAAIVFFFIYAGFFTPMAIAGLIAATVATFVEAIMLLIPISIYRTKYILTDEELIIKTTRLIGGSKSIRLRDVVTSETLFIPFGIRLFGASFHGGHYYIPKLGRAFMAITNFNDGVLIKTKHGNFIITPENPENFIESMRLSEITQK